MTKPKGPKPRKPWAGFPLFAHAGGTWAKKIDGKHRHFGPWAKPRDALKAYNEFMGAARLDVRPLRPKPGGGTIEDVADAYLTRQHDKARAGEIRLRSYRDCEGSVMSFVETVGADRPADSIRAEDFAAHARALSALGSYAYNRNVAIVRGMFKWAYGSELIEQPARYGESFSIRQESAKRRERRESELEHGKRLFAEDEIALLLSASMLPLNAMILLGINCAFGNTDVARLAWADVDLKRGWYEAPREKTMIERRAPLWPETVKALRDMRNHRPKAKDPADERLVFLTHFGVPFVREHGEEKDGVIQRVGVVDSVALLFGRLLESLQLKRRGRSFYALRATFRTWAVEADKEIAAQRIMGHAIAGVTSAYVRRVSDEDLLAVSNHVRAKVFPALPKSARQKRIRR
jgi:integrase